MRILPFQILWGGVAEILPFLSLAGSTWIFQVYPGPTSSFLEQDVPGYLEIWLKFTEQVCIMDYHSHCIVVQTGLFKSTALVYTIDCSVTALWAHWIVTSSKCIKENLVNMDTWWTHGVIYNDIKYCWGQDGELF